MSTRNSFAIGLAAGALRARAVARWTQHRSILMTSLISGKADLQELFSRLLRWRVGARWYAAALLPGPLLVAAVLFTLSLVSPRYSSPASSQRTIE